MTTPTPGETIDRAAFLLQWYADCLRTRGKADDLAAFPYVPEMEEVAAQLRALPAGGEWPEAELRLFATQMRERLQHWWGHPKFHLQEQLESDLRRAMRAAHVAAGEKAGEAVPSGWVMVPLEPTFAMLDAGAGAIWEALTAQRHALMRSAWAAMLAASPRGEGGGG